MQLDDLEFEAWLATRKAAGEAIDIATCKFMWRHVQVLDPYGYRIAAGTFSDEEDCIGRYYFVCSEDSDGWIWEGDLPEEKRRALEERTKRETTEQDKRFAAIINDREDGSTVSRRETGAVAGTLSPTTMQKIDEMCEENAAEFEAIPKALAEKKGKLQ